MDPEARIGTLLAGKYRIERVLGTGGMGAVYEAVHTGVKKRFAIKVLRAAAAAASDGVLRFMQEAQAAARVQHPNIVDVFDVGEADDGSPFMVMELLRGRSLHEALGDGAFSVERAVGVACEMLRALEAAHQAGVVHRDIKPANVFLVEGTNGTMHVKVLDFGVAKVAQGEEPGLTQSGAIVGTPLYMAPEQFLAEKEIDGRADVWAVGATLFQMLTDRPVHHATSAAAAAAKVVSEPAPRVRSVRPDDVDEILDSIVARALSIDRGSRYASAASMLAALELHTVGASETIPGTGLSLPSRSSSASRPGPTPKGPYSSPSAASEPRASVSTPHPRVSVGRHALLGLISGVAGALVTVMLLVRGTTSPPPATTPLPPLPTAPDVARASLVDAPPPQDAALAPVASTARPPPSSAGKPRPSCSAGEVLSLGHCCAKGYVWQSERCERPLATDF